MAENVKSVAKSDDGEVIAVKSQSMVEIVTPESTLCSDKKGHENITPDRCGKEDEAQPKEQELAELIRNKDVSKGMPQCMPYINLSELATILRDPNMPSQKILKEVADKIMLKSEESESDDGSVSSGGGVVGMKGLLDCIFEVSYMHEDSASSDDDDDSFERIPREIPCKFCSKIFGSTMTWNTHVLVAHAQQDSSVHNLRRLSTNESDGKDKNLPSKKHTRFTPKSDCDAKDTKVRHTSATDRKHIGSPHSENVPFRKRRSSFSKSQPKEDITGKSVNKDQSPACEKRKEPLPVDSKIDKTPTCGLVTRDEEVDRIVSRSEVVESVCADQPFDETDICPGGAGDNKSIEFLPGNRDGEPGGPETSCLDNSDQNIPANTGKQQNNETVGDTLYVPDNTSASNINLPKSAQPGRKRKSASPLPESTISSPASSKPKCSKRNTEKKSVSTSEHKHSESSTDLTPSARRLRSRTSKQPK